MEQPSSPTHSEWSVISVSEYENDVRVWLTDACKIFARFPYEQIITNDSQYDIDSLREAYEAKCTELEVKLPVGFFNKIVHQCCKKERYRPQYDDIEEDDDLNDRTNYNQDIYQ